jgi:hypothetical protein
MSSRIAIPDARTPSSPAKSTTTLTRALLACGVVAGPLFTVVAQLQVLTRQGSTFAVTRLACWASGAGMDPDRQLRHHWPAGCGVRARDAASAASRAGRHLGPLLVDAITRVHGRENPAIRWIPTSRRTSGLWTRMVLVAALGGGQTRPSVRPERRNRRGDRFRMDPPGSYQVEPLRDHGPDVAARHCEGAVAAEHAHKKENPDVEDDQFGEEQHEPAPI